MSVHLGELLSWEAAWVELFCGLKDGVPEQDIETWGGSGMFIRAAGDKEKLYVSTEEELKEQTGRETIHTWLSGQEPQSVTQPKFIESQHEMEEWQRRKKEIERNFESIVMGDELRVQRAAAWPAEPHIWKALKDSKTKAQVRKAYSKSKIWLKSRKDFPRGGFVDWSWNPIPRALYDHADKFCRAKRDKRYPARDQRASGDYRRIEYFARVMAGLSLYPPISPSYSIDLLRKKNTQIIVFAGDVRTGSLHDFPRASPNFWKNEQRSSVSRHQADKIEVTKKAGLPAVTSSRQALTTKGGVISNGSYADRTSTSSALQFRPDQAAKWRCDSFRLWNQGPR